MTELVVWGIALAFLGLGLVALVAPAFVTGVFGIARLTDAMRNEVRAVYGGFGVVVACLLVFSRYSARYGDGIILAAALSLLGMAAGRALSALFDRRFPKVGVLIMGIEIVAGTALLATGR